MQEERLVCPADLAGKVSDSERSDLGADCPISRRDFIAGVLTAASAATPAGALLAEEESTTFPDAKGWQLSPAAFNGPGGTGDYSDSNGNVYSVVNSAHRVRDAILAARNASRVPVEATGEVFDLVVVGGGPSGLGSAFYFTEQTGRRASCLILDNHPMPGGLAKRNELSVDGVRLMAPQCSNVTVYSTGDKDIFGTTEALDKIGFRREWRYAGLTGTDKPLEFDRTNYVYYYPPCTSDSIGHFYRDETSRYRMVRNPWANGFAGAPLPERVKRDLMHWRNEARIPQESVLGEAIGPWLDRRTHKEYMTGHHGLSPEAYQLLNNWVAGAKAFSGEMCSAYSLMRNSTGGYKNFGPGGLEERFDWAASQGVGVFGFPGGNALQARFFLNYLIPGVFNGDRPEDVINGPINRSALDLPDSPVRVRVGATVIDVRHQQKERGGHAVEVSYEQDGRLRKVRARNVIMASGAWINRRILSDAPAEIMAAMADLKHAPMMIANVALRNWRFLERAGLTACLWHDGAFGFQCNIRRPLVASGYSPPLDPDKPIFLTFYVPFPSPGLPTAAQLSLGRQRLMGTSFSDFELLLRKQMTELFAPFGFDAKRDIAGLILNRWGHAYIVTEPGFFFGRDGHGPTTEILREEGFGAVRFANAEVSGYQSYETALQEAQRAVEQVLISRRS
ncbi:MAG: NAD(P)-binding protein [Chromatocurvus sp.]